jgi:hypothetical protein
MMEGMIIMRIPLAKRMDTIVMMMTVGHFMVFKKKTPNTFKKE